tara:strand:- start:165 stop:464 length:300 start_codon:yes stop_codon:yes gene_type:complete
MNPHVELVRKYLDNPESVSLKELEANETAATADLRNSRIAYKAAAYAVGAANYNAHAVSPYYSYPGAALVASESSTTKAKRYVQDYEALIKKGERDELD